MLSINAAFGIIGVNNSNRHGERNVMDMAAR